MGGRCGGLWDTYGPPHFITRVVLSVQEGAAASCYSQCCGFTRPCKLCCLLFLVAILLLLRLALRALVLAAVAAATTLHNAKQVRCWMGLRVYHTRHTYSCTQITSCRLRALRQRCMPAKFQTNSELQQPSPFIFGFTWCDRLICCIALQC
jgi:hypothetical protein